MDAVGYIRTLAWGPASETEPGPQEEAIRSWAESRGCRLVAVEHDELAPGSEGLERRLALARVFEILRTGSAKAIVVARLDRLADDLVSQERILADFRAWGGEVFSAEPDEELELGDEPADAERAMVRRVLATSPDYEQTKRELLIKHQVARTGMPRDRQQAAVARIEELAGEGASIDEIAARLRAEGVTPRTAHILVRARLRRVLSAKGGRAGDVGRT